MVDENTDEPANGQSDATANAEQFPVIPFDQPLLPFSDEGHSKPQSVEGKMSWKSKGKRRKRRRCVLVRFGPRFTVQGAVPEI